MDKQETVSTYGCIDNGNMRICYDYYDSGKVHTEYHYLNGVLHREDLPAVMCYHERSGKRYIEEYFKAGKCHRENGPAKIVYEGNGNIQYEYYLLEGKCHREDGPAYISYYKNGKISCKAYYLNGVEYTDKYIKSNWKDFCKMQIFQ